MTGYIEPTIEDLGNCLSRGGMFYDYGADPSVKDRDLCFYEYMQAHNLRPLLTKFADDLKKIEDSSLELCLENPNPNFTVTKKVETLKVDIDRLKELYPRLYEEYRELPNAAYHKLFTPWQMIGIMKANGISDAVLDGFVTVNKKSIEKLVEKKYRDAVFVPNRVSYTVFETTP